MKILVALVTAISLSAASAFAGDCQISNHSLARMGLQGMKALSDADGMSIRGRAILFVAGHTSVANNSAIVLASATGVTSGSIVVTIAQFQGGLFAGTGVSASAH